MQVRERVRSRPEVSADRRTAAAEARASRAEARTGDVEALAAQRVEAARRERDAARAELTDMREDRDRWRAQAERLAGALERLRVPAPPAVAQAVGGDGGPDLLVGMAAIAAFLGVTPRQAWHLQDACGLPTFKQGRTVCARKSTLAQHFAQSEASNGKH